MKFEGRVPLLDCPDVVIKISMFIKEQLLSQRKDGIVIGLSGGVDSALCLNLCVEAIGKEHILGLILPERESSPQSKEYAVKESRYLGVHTEIIDITEALQSLGTYQQRDSAIKEIFPGYDGTQKSKMVLPVNILEKDAYNFYTLILEDSKGKTQSARLNNPLFRKITSANNLKQRTRMLYLYRYAEMNNYLVCGTTNRSEFIQGFFVKYGDGGVDIEPIADLYKTQVYQLAGHMGVSQKIIERAPTPDTFSLGVTDEEFYFRMPYDKLDVFLYAWEKHIPVAVVSEICGYSIDQVSRIFRDFNTKYKVTNHLRVLPPSPVINT
jgi:NAD+ synthase